LFDKEIPFREKWMVILPLIYILSPVDLIPAPVLGFSIIDDLVMMTFLYTFVWDKVNKYYGSEAGDDVKKNIVEDVEYEVRSDEEEDK
jgi:uncharacterized membrane protein YkvA (DUF1232 family)